MAQLTQRVLDPLWEQYGGLTLTYGFASPALTKHIHGRICPRLDQHAGCEVNRRGNMICSRKGLAVDLIIPGQSSLDVAVWVREHLAFDRLYYYGEDRPIHVSVGPEETRATITMKRYGERLVPRKKLPVS